MLSSKLQCGEHICIPRLSDRTDMKEFFLMLAMKPAPVVLLIGHLTSLFIPLVSPTHRLSFFGLHCTVAP